VAKMLTGLGAVAGAAYRGAEFDLRFGVFEPGWARCEHLYGLAEQCDALLAAVDEPGYA
jgi:hypothetical protein